MNDIPTLIDFYWMATSIGYICLAVLPLFWLSLCLQAPLGILRRSRMDIFSPTFLVAGALLIGTTLRTCFLMLDQPAPERIQRLLGNNLPDDILLPGLVAINLAIVMWVVGYLSLPTNRFSKQNSVKVLNPTRYYTVLGLMTLAGLVLVGLYLQKINFIEQLANVGLSAKRFISINNEVSPIGHLRIGADLIAGLALIQALYYYVIDHRPRNAVLLGALVGLAVFVPFVASVRGEIIYLLFSILVVRHYGYKKVRAWAIVVALIVSFLILGFMETLRQRTTDNGANQPINFHASQVLNTMIYTPHFIGVGKTSVVIHKVPRDLDYLYGKSYAMTLIAPIPRVLWQDKPVVRIGRFVGQKIYERPNRSGVPPGLIGEAYLNFGWPGIVFILTAAGWLSKLAYSTLILKRCSTDVVRLGIYAIIVITIIDVMVTDFTGNVMRMARYLIPFLLFMWLMGKQHKPANE